MIKRVSKLPSYFQSHNKVDAGISSDAASILGCFSLLLWSTSALIITFLQDIPILQILSINLSISFIIIFGKIAWFGEWDKIKQPLIIWLIGVAGVYGNDLTYIWAFHFAPPAEVELVSYLWPVVTILIASLLPKETFTLRHLAASLIALSGIYVLISNSEGWTGFNMQYLKGYSLALIGVFNWSIYCVLSRYFKKTPMEMIGMYCGIGALLSIFGHMQWETTVAPSMGQWVLMLYMGGTVVGPAFMMWDKGMKHGSIKLLSIFSFAVPIISIALLILFDKTKADFHLAIACALVVTGAYVATNSVSLGRFFPTQLWRRLTTTST